MNTYRDLIRSGAEAITAALRRAAMTGEPVFAFALFTTDSRPGEIVALAGWNAQPAARIGEFEIIRTNYGDRWNSVPYSAVESLLYDACRRSPILPRE